LLFFPIMAVLVIVVVVGVIRIVPGRSRPPEGPTTKRPATPSAAPIETDDKKTPVAAPDAPPSITAPDDSAPPVEPVSDAGATDDEAGADVADDEVGEPVPAGREESSSDPDAGDDGESAPPSESVAAADGDEAAGRFAEVVGWRFGPVRIATSVFGFRTVGSSGPRYAVVAPREQRYLWLTANLTRSAETAGTIAFAPHDEVPATVTLSGGGARYLPLGRLREDARPWAPFDGSPVAVEPGSNVEVTWAYLLPDALPRVEIECEGVWVGERELPAAERLAIHELVGYWVKSPELISSLRFEDAIADAIASREGLLLHFEPAGLDSVRATFPGPGIASTPLERSPRDYSAALKLQWGDHATPAWVRMTDGGRRVLLYVGEPSGAAFVFEPAK
jgi:hypothetical protein